MARPRLIPHCFSLLALAAETANPPALNLQLDSEQLRSW